MSSKPPLDRAQESLALRLSIWFALLFTVGFTAIFAVLYWSLGRQLLARDTEALQLRLRQYAGIYAIAGVYGLESRYTEDSQAAHVRSLFVRLVNRNGTVEWARIPSDWIEADPQRVPVPDITGGEMPQQNYTVRVPRDEEQDLAVAAQVLPDGRLLQVARSTDSRAVLLAPLRHTFLWIGGAVVVVGFGAGFFTARRAMRPLRDVIATARRIAATGALDTRVPAPPRNDEIAELVRAFNTVLDKNAGLLRAMREALDNVAHDLRTPLTRLRGTAEIALQSSGGSGAQGEALADCVEQTDDVLRLLRALMEISEAEAGMLKLDQAPADLGVLARAAADLYAEVAEAKPVLLDIEVNGPVPVQADAVRLRQAIANLIDNAVKYTPAGGRVKVRAAVAEAEGLRPEVGGVRPEAGGLRSGNEAVLTVSDTGPGVPPAEQSRIWERLYRGDSSRSQRGLGLGLSLVRVIAEAHGGRITQHNASGGGAVFELRLPLA